MFGELMFICFERIQVHNSDAYPNGEMTLLVF